MHEIDYFDGITPIPHKGLISLSDNFFEITFTNKPAIYIPYKDISRIENIAGECSLILNDKLYTSKKIIIRDKEIIQSIEQNYTNHLHFFKKTENAVQKMAGSKLVLISLVVIPIFSAFIFLAFAKSYLIIPRSYDKRIGEKSFNFVTSKYKTCQNKKGIKVLNQLQSKLTGNHDIHISVIDYPVINAMAFPGGRIIIFSKLLENADSPEEIYAILAHEVAHEEKRHSMQLLTRSMGSLFISSLIIGGALEGIETLETISEIFSTVIMMKYSRGFEEEADKIAIKILSDQKVSLKGFRGFFEKNKPSDGPLKNQEFLEWWSTHPADSKRIANIEAAMKSSKYSPLRLLSNQEWNNLKKICSPD